MQTTPSIRPFAHDPTAAARAERVADQHCCDSALMKGIAMVIAVIAIVIIGAALTMEWPALFLPIAFVGGVWAYECLFKRACCC